MSEKLKEVREEIEQLKLLLNLEKEENLEISINENKDTYIVTAKRKNGEGEVFILIPK